MDQGFCGHFPSVFVCVSTHYLLVLSGSPPGSCEVLPNLCEAFHVLRFRASVTIPSPPSCDASKESNIISTCVYALLLQCVPGSITDIIGVLWVCVHRSLLMYSQLYITEPFL